jgi:tetratricopeptide (TPR) repeat protein
MNVELRKISCGSNGKVAARTRLLAISATLILTVLSGASLSQDASDHISQLYAEAKQDENSGHIDEAIQKLQEIIKLDPTLAAAYNNLGRLYYQNGRLQEAIKPLQRAAQIDPKLEPPHALLGFVYFQLENFEEAHRELKEASRLNPADSTARLFLARSLVQLNDLEGALKLLTQLQHEDPKNAEVLFTLGNLYSTLAETTFGKIQTQDPNSYLLEVVLGKVAEIKQVYADAAEHYKRAIERAPDVPDLYYKYAHALWESGDSTGALRVYNQDLQRNPYDYRAQWESARILLSDNPQEALNRADRALAVKPAIAGAETVRGRALMALEKPTDAIEAFKKAIKLDPEDSTIHFQLARAYRQAGLVQEAQNENAIYERMDKEAHAAKEQKLPDSQ